MRFPLLTPWFLVICARLALLPSLGGLAASVLVVDGPPVLAAAATFLAAIVLLQAVPKVRAAEMLGLLALFGTMLEWTQASLVGGIDSARWQSIIAVTGAMVLLLKVQHLRSLAREDPCVPLRQLERRNILLSRTRKRPKTAPEAPSASLPRRIA